MPHPCPQPAFDFAFPAYHDIRIQAGDGAAAIAAIASTLAASAAQMVKLSATAGPEGAAFSLRLTGADAASARALTDRIATHAGVISAQVEHIWWRSAP
jgi:hypothetical protein